MKAVHSCPHCALVVQDLKKHIRNKHPETLETEKTDPPGTPTGTTEPENPPGTPAASLEIAPEPGSNPSDGQFYHCVDCGYAQITKGQSHCPACGETLAWEGVQ